MEIPARRGEIIDRRGVKLASSVEVDSVWGDPSMLPDVRTTSVSDAGGRYRVEGVPAGRYSVVCDTGNGKPSESGVNLLDREERAWRGRVQDRGRAVTASTFR